MTEALLISAAETLRDTAGALAFQGSVHSVYNPLAYAWEPHREYLSRYGGGSKRVLFLGMNPGPWGMAQTGIPFGEVEAVRDWLALDGRVDTPPAEHPKRPVQGFACPKSEVSGRRLWGLMRDRFGTPEEFFKDHWVDNYCPLVFMEASGKNFTPDKLPAAQRKELYNACDSRLAAVIRIINPKWLVGVGKFAMNRFTALYEPSGILAGQTPPNIGWILHPSPASPMANRGWAQAAEKQLKDQGIWV